MAENIVELLTDVADAIREKKGTTEPINAQAFSEEIRTIESGGEGIQDIVDTTGRGVKGIQNVIIKDGVTTIVERAYSETNIESVSLPYSVETIGKAAFYKTQLQRLIIPPLVQVYEYELTQNCQKLSEVHIPEGVTTIKGYAFKNCTSLPKIVLPSTITALLDAQQFYGCTQLRTFVIKAITPPILNNSALSNGSAERSIFVPDESVEAYKSATNWSVYADQIKPLSELPNEE